MAVKRSELRAGDTDRQAVVAALREHYAAGRLSADEFDERLSAALEAKTFGDLDRLIADLPVLGGKAPAVRGSRPPAKKPGRQRAPVRPMVVSWALVSTLTTFIWIMSGAGSFWPIWVIVPYGLIILAKLAKGPREQ